MKADETRNITVALPASLLKRVKLLAVRRESSVSALLRSMLYELVTREEELPRARRRHLAWLSKGANLGTRGQTTWSREDLHDR